MPAPSVQTAGPKEVRLWPALKKKLLEDSKKSPPDPKALETLLWMVEQEMV